MTKWQSKFEGEVDGAVSWQPDSQRWEPEADIQMPLTKTGRSCGRVLIHVASTFFAPLSPGAKHFRTDSSTSEPAGRSHCIPGLQVVGRRAERSGSGLQKVWQSGIISPSTGSTASALLKGTLETCDAMASIADARVERVSVMASAQRLIRDLMYSSTVPSQPCHRQRLSGTRIPSGRGRKLVRKAALGFHAYRTASITLGPPRRLSFVKVAPGRHHRTKMEVRSSTRDCDETLPSGMLILVRLPLLRSGRVCEQCSRSLPGT